mgnify:CR=1 FL=1
MKTYKINTDKDKNTELVINEYDEMYLSQNGNYGATKIIELSKRDLLNLYQAIQEEILP